MSSKKTTVIVNPASRGGRTGKNWPHIKNKITAALGAFDEYFTTQCGDGTLIAQSAIQNGSTRIIGVGGDGTQSEIANGFLKGNQLVNPATTLGVIHAGTGGDLCRNLNLGATVAEQLAVIQKGTIKKISVGHATFETAQGTARRYFLVICAYGFSSAVNKAVNKRPMIKKILGPTAFISATILELFKYKNTPITLTVDHHNSVTKDILIGAACNGPYTGGGMNMAPAADPNSDTLDFLTASGISKMGVLGLLPKLYNGSHLGHPAINLIRGQSLIVSPPSDRRTYLDMDGDVQGFLPAKIDVMPNMLPVYMP